MADDNQAVQWSSSDPILTHCKHGLDLRLHPRCYLCHPAHEHGWNMGGELATRSDDWRSLAHDFRVYAQHAPNCAYQPTYPETGATKCDCAFDVLLDRYDRLSAT